MYGNGSNARRLCQGTQSACTSGVSILILDGFRMGLDGFRMGFDGFRWVSMSVEWGLMGFDGFRWVLNGVWWVWMSCLLKWMRKRLFSHWQLWTFSETVWFGLISTAGGDIFMNKARFPSILGFGPADHTSLRDAAILMLETYNWTTVSLLCGTLYQFAAPFDVTACVSLKTQLRKMWYRFDVTTTDFDPEKRQHYAAILTGLQNQSRSEWFKDAKFVMPCQTIERFFFGWICSHIHFLWYHFSETNHGTWVPFKLGYCATICCPVNSFSKQFSSHQITQLAASAQNMTNGDYVSRWTFSMDFFYGLFP